MHPSILGLLLVTLQTPAEPPVADGPATVSLLLARGAAWESLSEEPAARAALDGLAFRRANRLGVVDLEVPGDATAEDRARRLAELSGVEHAWVPGHGTWLDAPNDQDYDEQWHLANDGGGGGVVGADVGAEAAWDVDRGDPSVVIAFLDSGVEITHPDLAPNVWHNTGEIANGVDDDGNGLVDDLDGWDFHNDEPDVSGPFSHGTRVSGTACARTNDGFGVAGLAGGWGAAPGCRLMAVGVGDTFPDASVLDDAILYAIDEGARVINLSLSVPSDPAIDLALADAASNDVLVVAAAGNGGGPVSYPANHPDVMAVAATRRDDSIASFSAGGVVLDLAAPGEDVWTTDAGGTSNDSTGTSFASPLVCGAAGLLFSRLPSLTALEARAILVATADDIGPPGPDLDSGAGRLDAGAALALLDASDCDGDGVYDPRAIATGLVADGNGDGVPDVCQLGTPFCFGDGSNPTACPCGNEGGAGEGCANSTGSGATLEPEGSPVVAAADYRLRVAGARPGEPAVLLQGLSPAAFVFKDGILCLGAPTERIEVLFLDDAGAADSSSDLAELGGISPGTTARYQVWYRDPTTGPCGTGSNFSAGVVVDWF